MPKLRVHNLAMSLDGYAAGPDQSVDNPLDVAEVVSSRSSKVTHVQLVRR
jgi:hypothetical protein